jgi:hypothetical protein
MIKTILNWKYYIIVIFIFFFTIQGCSHKTANPVLNYIKNSQLTFSNKMQRDVVKEAMLDILTLDEKYLVDMRYKDSNGNDSAWNLQQVVQFYFVPNKPGVSLGDDFYSDVKDDSVMVEIGRLYMKY